MDKLNTLNKQKSLLQDMQKIISSEKQSREYSLGSSENSINTESATPFDIESIDESLLTKENQQKLAILLGTATDEGAETTSKTSLFKNILNTIMDFAKALTTKSNNEIIDKKPVEVTLQKVQNKNSNPFQS